MALYLILTVWFKVKKIKVRGDDSVFQKWQQGCRQKQHLREKRNAENYLLLQLLTLLGGFFGIAKDSFCLRRLL